MGKANAKIVFHGAPSVKSLGRKKPCKEIREALFSFFILHHAALRLSLSYFCFFHQSSHYNHAGFLCQAEISCILLQNKHFLLCIFTLRWALSLLLFFVHYFVFIFRKKFHLLFISALQLSPQDAL